MSQRKQACVWDVAEGYSLGSSSLMDAILKNQLRHVSLAVSVTSSSVKQSEAGHKQEKQKSAVILSSWFTQLEEIYESEMSFSDPNKKHDSRLNPKAKGVVKKTANTNQQHWQELTNLRGN